MKRFFLTIFFLTSMNSKLICDAVNETNKFLELYDFSEGLNTRDAPIEMTNKFSPNLSNVLIDEKESAIKVMNGYSIVIVTPTLSKISFSFSYHKTDGTEEFIVSDSSRLFSTQDFSKFTVIKNTMSSTSVIRAAQVRDKVWIVDGVNSVFTWDGINIKVLNGQGGTPSVPIGKYISFYQERVFIFNSTTSDSSLHFSALTSTDGLAISPEDQSAWPITNRIDIGRGDGEKGTALFSNFGKLFIGKEKSIYTLFGTGESSYYAIKMKNGIGIASNDSVAENDNEILFFTNLGGKIGINTFNGQETNRITDAILPSMIDVSNNISRTVSNEWKNQSDFINKKQLLGGATVNNSGNLVIFSSMDAQYFNGVSLNNDAGIPFNDTSSTTTLFLKISSALVDPYNFYDARISELRLGFFPYPTPSFIAKVTIRDLDGGKTGESSFLTSDFTSRVPSIPFPSTFTFNTRSIINSSFTMEVSVDTTSFLSGTTVRVSSFNALPFPLDPSGRAEGSLIVIANTSAAYVSEVSTISTITAWDIFNTNHNLNNGMINFYLKSATSSVNISTEIWTLSSPGSLITFPTAKNYIQWTATITNPNIDNNTFVSKVSISHIEGSGNDSRAVAASWKNRYWISVSTLTESPSRIIYLKAKKSFKNPNAWMKVDGIPANSFGIFKENFYAGSSTAGAILRLDFGNDFNGSGIDWYYETPDIDFGNRYFKKKQLEMIVSAKSINGGSFDISYSTDSGEFISKSISVGSGKNTIKSIKDVTALAKYFRYRFSGNSSGVPYEIYRFLIRYDPTLIRD